MRLLINALGLRYGGGVTLLRHQLGALATVAPHIQIHTLVSPWSEVGELPGSVEIVPVRGVGTRFAYEQLRLPFRKPDVLYCVGNFAPLVSRAPTVLLIQNAHYYRCGIDLVPHRGLSTVKVHANHLAMRTADSIISVSQSLADDANRTVSGVAKKMNVVSSAAPEWPDRSTSVSGIPDRYLLTVSSESPHKRLDDTVQAWAHAARSMVDPAALVVVGRFGSVAMARHRAAAAEQASLLFHTGPILERSSLKWLYEHALALIQMSALESFSFTPIEAGSVGCPLVVSDIPVHHEVTLGNAEFVRVGDISALSNLIVTFGPRWAPGSRPWTWPVTWQLNAIALLRILEMSILA